MRIVSADSAAATLDENFAPKQLVASTAVLVEPPYREARIRLSEPIFKTVDDSYDAIVGEARLCQTLLETVKADVVHLDSTLGSAIVDELSPVELSNLHLSTRARLNLLRILPKLRKVAGEIRRKHGIETLAIGKESAAVRIAELTAGSEAILYACSKALEKDQTLLVGLPSKCVHQIAYETVYLNSLIEAEFDVRGYAKDEQGILEKVTIIEMLNPVARGFRALRIEPKK